MTHSALPDRVTVVLAAGGARGLAHVGVLQALEARGVQIERLVGSSMGAIVAAVYALDGNTERLETRLQEGLAAAPTRWSWHPRRLELFETRPYRRLLRQWFGERSFADLRIPVTVNAVDLHSGQEVQMSRGRVVPALLAASAIPGLYAGVRHGDQLLVDGGLVNPLPLNLARGAAFVLAVDVYPEMDERMEGAHRFGERGSLRAKYIQAAAVLGKAYGIAGAYLRDAALRADPPALLIRPDLRGISSMAYTQGATIIARGREAAEQALE
jgi:NTE family protein